MINTSAVRSLPSERTSTVSFSAPYTILEIPLPEQNYPITQQSVWGRCIELYAVTYYFNPRNPCSDGSAQVCPGPQYIPGGHCLLLGLRPMHTGTGNRHHTFYKGGRCYCPCFTLQQHAFDTCIAADSAAFIDCLG
ncbi:hypothetical protein AG1IA_00336 [Rhizoctonia solani AG-1 IA]|uniref:Uncharacterized protein n=1 Tax=Thanatephorus cucumeris (strain AG1-IA) TaxID=983506 RepID=L8X943_THACA|nr:hypothetical protein AG1IA_00336 [Rhizoctonia solani AG-1 IA]